MKPSALVILVAVLAGCSAGSDESPRVVEEALVSRGADGDCVKAWNSPGNVANRDTAASRHQGWSLSLSEWMISHANPNPSGDDLIGTGCSYFFASATHWRSYSGGWEADGDLRWNMPQEARGRRTPEQQLEPPNAVLRPEGTIARLAGDNVTPVAPDESRAVIDDWYDNGTIDLTHRCAAVRAAIELLPAEGSNITTAHDDLRRYADVVC